MDERASVELIDALARIWTRIRLLQPEVPGVVLLAAPAAHGVPNSLGHFAPLRWKGPRTVGDPVHEVVVIAEFLDRPVEEILGTLIHEAAHAWNFARKIHDCSASQYHNRKFKAAAEELGLEVVQAKHYGFAFTKLALGTATMYEAEIKHLESTLIHRRRPVAGTTKGGEEASDESNNEEDGKSSSRSRKAVCRCEPPFIIRVSKATIDATSIICGTCGDAFALA